MPMTSDDLRGLLRDEGFVGTPPGNPGRAGQIEHRIARRRRRLRGQVAAVAATVLAVAGLSTAASRGVFGGVLDGGDPAASGTASARPMPTVALPAAVPVEKLWPQAVVKVPARLPNGRKYYPEAFVGNRTLLVTTSGGFERTDAIWLYDTGTRRLSQVTRVTTPAKATTFASDFAVGDGRVVWWTARRAQGEIIAEIWSAPLSGGEARKIVTMPAGKEEDSGIGDLVIAGGKVFWSLSAFTPQARGGLFEAPLTGGPPTKIPGTDRHQIVEWPWIGTPGRNDAARPVTFKDVRNVVTGERRSAEVGPGRWTCDVTWCVSYGGPDTRAVRRDGTGGRVLPGEWPFPTDIALDRFLLYSGPRTMQLYDLRSGRLADLGAPRQPRSYTAIQPGDRIYRMDRADGYLIVDFTAVR
ncbi:MAG TPA: hypothetical protein VFU43_03610 [Streptosporangiaceae bacterium]|nr:hypothetical protein [Streptosporangiaceae bacterium]